MNQILSKSFVAVLLLIFFISTGVSFGFFRLILKQVPSELASPIAPEEEQKEAGIDFGDLLVDIAPDAVRNSPCPLNGEYYTSAEKDVWSKRRPMAIMIENHLEARPQSGLSTADIVYEAVAEGAITRFMGVFYCDSISHDNIIGPVRSARTYFLDWASEYSKNPIYVHVGGANTPNKADALGQIEDYGWGGENDLNQFGLSVKECWRDYNRLNRLVATEHTMYCSNEALWKVADGRGWAAVGQDKKPWEATFTPWKFADPKPVSPPQVTKIEFDFWAEYKDYTVRWDYDSAANLYKRTNGNQTHVDRNINQQLAVRTVIIQFEKETGPIDDHMHLLYGTTGSGKAMVFQNGAKIEGTWTKKDRLSRTIYKDSSGKEITFARGKMWIETLPIGDPVSTQ